jgi:hypothetical protein
MALSSLSDPIENPVTTAKPQRRISDRRWTLLELVLIFLAVWAFCAAFLDLGAQTRLPGTAGGQARIMFL